MIRAVLNSSEWDPVNAVATGSGHVFNEILGHQHVVIGDVEEDGLQQQ